MLRSHTYVANVYIAFAHEWDNQHEMQGVRNLTLAFGYLGHEQPDYPIRAWGIP